jgi:2-polyprenyl-3-methyl-5-hydroxy-6-metoxy-1,4-benzoquinol methylase
LPSAEFDVIVCWWLLEHLSQPQKALNNLLKAIKEGGIIILAVPNVFSIKALIAKYAPFWTHEWYLRKLAFPTKDYTPFPTYLRFSMKRIRLSRQDGG